MHGSRFIHNKSNSRFVVSINNRVKQYGYFGTIVIILIAALICSQIERLSSQGTLLGYEVRHVRADTKSSNRTVAGNNLGAMSQKSVACEKVTQSDVSKVLKVGVEKAQSFLADRQTPDLISSCIYRTTLDPKSKIPIRTVSILYREFDSTNTAKQSLDSVQKRPNVETLKQIGDESYYLDSASQLTVRKGSTVLTITISKAVSGQIKSKDAALALSKMALHL